ncbi:hypothetical protein MKX01_024106 [Papaver californicum]|nr:hypothetical protein MKX01_024106 [Papaver californicum]
MSQTLVTQGFVMLSSDHFFNGSRSVDYTANAPHSPLTGMSFSYFNWILHLDGNQPTSGHGLTSWNPLKIGNKKLLGLIVTLVTRHDILHRMNFDG